MPLTRPQAIVVCAFAVMTALVSAGLLALAIVAVPSAMLPLPVLLCVGCLLAACCELRPAIRSIRRSRTRRSDRRLLDTLRRQLDELPETRHPLGL